MNEGKPTAADVSQRSTRRANTGPKPTVGGRLLAWPRISREAVSKFPSLSLPQSPPWQNGNDNGRYED